ncbi:hypothetical protein [Mucilaginibacter sp.]|uniref:hypothetical protein n=1 Tax=Mucilaginibacter sp. TaxID=1882438 RepID=UPI00284C59CE|nr:hypothetical protein [Mucilaginibacter sp.]MDR3695609.1 hypothetical protein [Mucilaginibacter sp.]
MAIFHGIQVYEILENGNLLNGIYTNMGLVDTKNTSYDIDSEIARKKKGNNSNGVEGIYDCRYIESYDNSITNCDLVISKHLSIYNSKNNGIYLFTWNKLDEPNKILWTGIGLMSGTTHISVSYIKPQNLQT